MHPNKIPFCIKLTHSMLNPQPLTPQDVSEAMPRSSCRLAHGNLEMQETACVWRAQQQFSGLRKCSPPLPGWSWELGHAAHVRAAIVLCLSSSET